jgi:hypothetical protein
MRPTLALLPCLFPLLALCQQPPLVTYAGGAGNESFNDVMQLSNGRVLVIGVADALDWLPQGVPITTLTNPGITNNQGTGKTAFILQLDSSLQNVQGVYALPPGGAEDFRFIKSTNVPGSVTGDLYISGNTSDSNTGGYFIGRLNNNFVNGAPTGFSWVMNVKCTNGEYPKIYQPWDVGGDGKVVYAYGDSHSYNWSAIYRMDANGNDEVVPNWRVHWPFTGGEFHGNGNAYPGGLAGLNYSAIVFKRDGVRCELRSPTGADHAVWLPDGNGGTRRGRWPLDVLFSSACTPGGSNNSVQGPGYSGYDNSATFTYGPQSICIDRRTNAMYIGFNAKSVLPGGEPDFEPAVMAMDADGSMLWWSRLYHEVDPQGQIHNSSPDQYIDALAVDYSAPPETGVLVVGARCHGNAFQNFWQGNQIAANPSANGFQNQFTGSNGNIHVSWLGKLTLANGTLKHSTYMAELAEGTQNLGLPHPDPNLDGWPDPNSGWPDVNTTYLAKNMMKVTSDGRVVVLGQGRRTITTANAYQKMVKPEHGGLSSWNHFVRAYENDLGRPIYSSLLVGQWDTLTQQGGDNVQLRGVFKNAHSLLVVGRHTGSGNQMPVANVPSWGNATFNGGSAVLARLTATELSNLNDSPISLITSTNDNRWRQGPWRVVPNPAQEQFTVSAPEPGNAAVRMNLLDVMGRSMLSVAVRDGKAVFERGSLAPGTYVLQGEVAGGARFHAGRVVLQ